MTAPFRAKIYRHLFRADITGLDRAEREYVDAHMWRFEIWPAGSPSPVMTGGRESHRLALLAACQFLRGMTPECGATVAECVCKRPVGHPPPHHCISDGCGGRWTGTFGTDDFDLVQLPGERLLGGSLFGFLRGWS